MSATRPWRYTDGTALAILIVALCTAASADADVTVASPPKAQVEVPAVKTLPRLDIKRMAPVDLKSLVKSPGVLATGTDEKIVTEPAKTPAKYPDPEGKGPSSATDFQSTPLPEDEPQPPHTGSNAPAESDPPATSSRDPRRPARRTPSSGESAATGTVSGPRRPASFGTLLGSALPSLGTDPVDGPDKDATRAGRDHEPGQIVFMTADIEAARRVAAGVQAEGFRVRSRETLDGLGLVMSVASLPPGVDAPAAAAVLAERFPDIVVDANHRYVLQGGGRNYAADLIGWTAASPCLAAAPIGMLDTPVDASDPALDGARVDLLDVLPAGLARPDARHGTAVATILAGARRDGFAGLHAGADVVAVNVFRREGKDRVDSTAAWIVQGLDVLSSRGVKVVNVSLGGADNRVLELAVRIVVARGTPVVAAAGNGGRDAPPSYPAAYPDVIAVTAVDADGRVFRRASRGEFVDFAAPGVDVYVPSGEGRYVSGTSYAAPFVTAAVAAIRARRADLAPRVITDYLASLSRDLGESGRDATYGFGLPDLSSHCAAIARLD